jgi:hypothetical protein
MSTKCRADALHDEIVEVLTRAVDDGASLLEVSGALHVALIQVQGQVYESFRLERRKAECQATDCEPDSPHCMVLRMTHRCRKAEGKP